MSEGASGHNEVLNGQLELLELFYVTKRGKRLVKVRLRADMIAHTAQSRAAG